MAGSARPVGNLDKKQPDQAAVPPSTFLLGAALVVLALAAYAPALNAGFIWDDDAYVTGNPTLRTYDGLVKIWTEPTATPQFYPLTFSTFWVEYRLWGIAPFGYHLINVLLHGLNGILIWLILRRLGVPAPWFIAAVFVVHPVQVESVAWITERKNVLSGAFYLAAALAWFRFSPPESATARPPHRWAWYCDALGLFACALLSKTVACTLPAALLLVTWWKRGRIAWRDIAALAPLFIVGVALALITVWMEKHHVGAVGAEWSLSPVERCLIAGRALCFYAAKLCWPAELTFIYARWQIDAGAVWQYFFPVAVLAAFACCWLSRRRFGTGPLVALLFFAGTLVPALGFVDVYPMRFSFVADHFQYMASVGLLTLLVVGGRAVILRFQSKEPWILQAAGVASLAILGALSLAHVQHFANVETLWRDTLAKNPSAWIAHNNLGEFLFDAGKFEEARTHYRDAIRLKPDEPKYYYNLGKADFYLGNVKESINAFEKAIQLDPDYAVAHFNLGLALRRLGQPDDAIRHFREAVRLNPTLAPAHNNLGVTLAQQGKPDEAIPHFLAAAESAADDPEPRYNLALIYAQRGEWRSAIEFAQQAEAIAPFDQRIRQLNGMLAEQAKKLPPP